MQGKIWKKLGSKKYYRVYEGSFYVFLIFFLNPIRKNILAKQEISIEGQVIDIRLNKKIIHVPEIRNSPTSIYLLTPNKIAKNPTIREVKYEHKIASL